MLATSLPRPSAPALPAVEVASGAWDGSDVGMQCVLWLLMEGLNCIHLSLPVYCCSKVHSRQGVQLHAVSGKGRRCHRPWQTCLQPWRQLNRKKKARTSAGQHARRNCFVRLLCSCSTECPDTGRRKQSPQVHCWKQSLLPLPNNVKTEWIQPMNPCWCRPCPACTR